MGRLSADTLYYLFSYLLLTVSPAIFLNSSQQFLYNSYIHWTRKILISNPPLFSFAVRILLSFPGIRQPGFLLIFLPGT